jgi:hypothetical protein
MADKNHKTIKFDEMLTFMADKHGVPQEDAVNVFSAFVKTTNDMIGIEADAGDNPVGLGGQAYGRAAQ